jgi:O-antigen/teichoic acid export membrane protein
MPASSAPPPDSGELAEEPFDDVLTDPRAGLTAVRGGVIRVSGYLIGTGLAAAASIFLLRYLGVTKFGQYITVVALLAIVGGLTDVGLTLIGQREYVLRSSDAERMALVANVLGIRLILTPIGIGLAAAFAALAGYGSTLTLGTLVAGAGLILGNVALTLSTPLAATLRFGALTATEVARQVVMVCGNGLLVFAGAGLIAFFGIYVVAGVVVLALTTALVGRRSVPRPRFAIREWVPVLQEAAPMGLAIVIGVFYMRALVVLASLLTNGFETGLFATSYRILEILFGIPALMIGAAFPILSRAGSNDDARLANALQRLVEITFLTAGLLVLILTVGAAPIVRILGGKEYASAAPVLRLHAIALLGSFASVVWTTGLITIRRQSALIVTNTIAFGTVAILAPILIPWLGAKGAAITAVIGESTLALAALLLLVRARPALAPRLGFGVRVLAAGALGATCAFIPGLPALTSAGTAAIVYSAAAWLLGAIPREAIEAVKSFGRRGSA